MNNKGFMHMLKRLVLASFMLIVFAQEGFAACVAASSTGGGTVCSCDNNAIPVDVKVTTATHDGNFGGLKAANDWIQINGCAGYKICKADDLYSYYLANGAPPSLSGTAVIIKPRSHDAGLYSLCNVSTAASFSSTMGSLQTWDFTAGGETPNSTLSCATASTYACCKFASATTASSSSSTSGTTSGGGSVSWNTIYPLEIKGKIDIVLPSTSSGHDTIHTACDAAFPGSRFMFRSDFNLINVTSADAVGGALGFDSTYTYGMCSNMNGYAKATFTACNNQYSLNNKPVAPYCYTLSSISCTGSQKALCVGPK